MYAKVRDTEIYFDVDGIGLEVSKEGLREKPVIFAIHGGPGGDHLPFKLALEPLTKVAQLVYFDHRGQGRSARGPCETYTLENNIEDMEALRQHLGLGKIIPFGTSYGGMVGMAYAIRYPQNISKLILAVTASDYRTLRRAQEILVERGSKEQCQVAQDLFNGTFKSSEHMKNYFTVLKPLYSRKAALRQLPPSAPDFTVWNHEAANVAFGGFLRTFNLTPRLHEIKAPTLVMGGRHDWICAPEFSEEIARLIPNAELKIFENSAHSLRLDEPELMLASLEAFLGES